MNDTTKPAVPAPPPPKAVAQSAPPLVPQSLTNPYDWANVTLEQVEATYQSTDGSLLRDPPPRYHPDGSLMDWAWVRAYLGGKPDVLNLMNLKTAGWLPRPAETFPGAPSTALEGVYPGVTLQVVQVGDLILVERHPLLGKRERALQEQVKQNNLEAVFKSANGVTSGDPMGGMRVEHFRETRGFQPD
jgi:hypothetical protein